MNTAERIEGQYMKPHSQETRIALLEQSLVHVNDTLTRIEKKLERVEERFDKIDDRFEKIENKIDSNMKWLIGLGVSILFSVASISITLFYHHNL